MARRSGLAAAALVPTLLVPVAPSFAGTVTSLNDSGTGTLRSQIALAAPGDTIGFQPGLTGTIVLNSELVIDRNLTIDGPSAQQLTLSGGDTTRVLRATGGANVTIEGVTIRDGRADGDEPVGAGVLSFDGGTVKFDRVELVDNEARKTGSVVPFGGGVAVFSGQLQIVDSTVAGNVVTDEGAGGGVFVAAPATFKISNSTITGNQAFGGGGILSGLATGSIVSSTIAGNTARHLGGGIGAFAPGVTLERSLVTGNSGTDGGPACDGPLATAGGNVIDSVAGCGITPGSTDGTGVPAPLGTLGAHGGPTRTMLPLAGSPALDHVASCTGADQRNVARPQGAACDAGAVEARPAQLSAAGPMALGSIQVGQQSAPVSVVIANAGELAASISAVSLTGPNATEVEPVADPEGCTAATVLGAGETCKLKARLSPTSAGAKTATYSVTIAGSVLNVPVTGAGLRPAQLEFSAPLALGSTLVGQHSAAGTTVITNTGDVDAAITAVALTGPNAAEVEPVADPDACSATTVLGAGDTCVLKARLAPTSPGAKTATYAVTMGGADLEVPITGTGDPPRPAQLVSAGPLALGSALVGQHSAAVTTTITNAGDLDADITAVTLGGPNAAEVERVAGPDDCTDATVLGAGETCKLKARLSPTSAGAKMATYTVALAGSSVGVAVSGTGDPVTPPAGNQGGGGASNTNPDPPAPTPSADAVLVGTSTKVKRGKLKLRLRCTAVATDRCAGSLTLKIGARKLTKAYSIAAGKDAVVTLKLGAGDRRRLAKKRSLKSAVTVLTTQPDGTRRTTHQGAFKLLR